MPPTNPNAHTHVNLKKLTRTEKVDFSKKQQKQKNAINNTIAQKTLTINCTDVETHDFKSLVHSSRVTVPV